MPGSTCNINDDCIYDLNIVHDDMEPDDWTCSRYRTLLDIINNESYIKDKFDGSLYLSYCNAGETFVVFAFDRNKNNFCI